MRWFPIRLRLAGLAALLALTAQPLAYAVEGSGQYVVKPGDTLAGISHALGVPLANLASLNGLGDPNRIVAGQTLVVTGEPVAAGEAGRGAPAATREYVVRPGDSLSRIAAEQGIPFNALVALNGLADPNRLIAGQKLKLPTTAPATAGGQPAEPATGQPGGSVGALLEDAARRYRLEPSVVKSLAWYLSGWRPDATSPGGASGPLQITTATQEWVSQALLKRPANRDDPRDNVELGVAYLAYLVNRLGDERQGVAAYLQGPAGLIRDGVNPTTARALDTIYGLRTRFSDSVGAAAIQATQTTQPTPAAQAGGGDLSAAILAAIRPLTDDARVGLAARNLTTGAQVDLRAEEAFPSASVNKMPIMLEVVRQGLNGKLTRTPAINADLENMIVQSDNDAANRLLDAVGEQSINSTLANLGLGSTVMHNYFSYAGGPVDPAFNQTSPANMATLLTLLANDRLLSPAASQEMRALLFRAQDASKLQRGLPAGTRLAHKSGWFQGVANDAGIVYTSRGSYVLAVFCDGVADAESGNQLIATVSRVVYERWGQ